MFRKRRANLLSCITESDESSPNKCEEQEQSSLVASPITGISQQLMNSMLLPHDKESAVSQDSEECSPSASQRLFKDTFKIKNTPENTRKSKPRARRLLGMPTRQFSNLSMSPSNDKENSSPTSPLGTSPQKIGSGRKFRNPLENRDLNNRGSVYVESYAEEEKPSRDGFRFAQPRALAPRRLSDARSPKTLSPLRLSPHRPVTPYSLFRSISSGYESLDDSFNDMTDAENLNDGTRLPNDISNLLSGDIFSDDERLAIMGTSNPTTPEFARTNCDSGNVRRSSQKQQEERKNSDLSKVRSCLFRSPTGSSSTVSPIFEDNTTLATRIPTVGRRRTLNLSPSHANSTVTISRKMFPRMFPLRCGFKRPDSPLTETTHVEKKPRKSSFFVSDIECETALMTTNLSTQKCVLQRSLSEPAVQSAAPVAMKMDIETESETDSEVQSELETHALIKSAIHRSTTNADLTGDFSKPCVLPLAEGPHNDLRSISTETMAALIRGQFNDQISSFKIVDCRYPYEFDAGHIQGALNLYSKDLIEQILLNPLTSRPEIQPDTNKRNILVFHCEFSFERGPNLSRFLRSLDRQRNKEHYPALHYPEVYLLHGGYKKFYKEQRELCWPQGYRPMTDPDHEADLRQFRTKSKSWQGEKSRINCNITPASLQRLGL